MDVLLYNVCRNLNRAYRTAEAFGVDRLLLLDCCDLLRGNLFKSKDRVRMERLSKWPNDLSNAIALETFYSLPLQCARWNGIRTIIIGGETRGLPKGLKVKTQVYIPMQGQISGLTVEAALAIALWEWRRHEHLRKGDG